MITYSTTNKVFLGVAAITVLSLVASWFVRDIDQLREPLVLITAACLLFMFVYAVFFPAYWGYFIRVTKTDIGFNLEYLNQCNEVQKREKINLEDLVSFSCFDHSSQVLTQTRLVFRSSGSVKKFTLLHKSRVKGVELQTTEIIDLILGKIAVFNQQRPHQFIERTLSFFSSKPGLYTIIALATILGFLVLSSQAKTEKVILCLFALAAMISALMLRRWNELKQIEKSNKRLLDIA
ncbi:hypothetical protein [Niabella hibiscisoli]|uniref:hypothetical protein n=1 Tax=Niabella hibiscisoli TaxID=1825928 RepID=UPI001F103C54|nr:hypothetical protein [Niabella hibiscisoli]MCH5716854.1 hypothetical protein [Niabella hibiscisoli]